MTRGDAFTTLARAIVGQQISVAAAQSVWNRVLLAAKKNNFLLPLTYKQKKPKTQEHPP
jgi:3-methyladenine DNA glycosylase/8-oxoguanine DNA glycosylase